MTEGVVEGFVDIFRVLNIVEEDETVELDVEKDVVVTVVEVEGGGVEKVDVAVV